MPQGWENGGLRKRPGQCGPGSDQGNGYSGWQSYSQLLGSHPNHIQAQGGGEEEGTIHLGQSYCDTLTSYSLLDTFQVAKKNRCPIRDWCFFSGLGASTPETKLPPLTSENKGEVEREHK